MENELKNAEQTPANAEQKPDDAVDVVALQARIKALESEKEKLKQSVTNASADASKWKKQYQEKLSIEEQAQAKQDEANAALQKELEDLRNERNIAKISGALVAGDIGMDTDTAGKVAEAMNAGETDKVLDGIRQFIAAHDKAMREASLKNNPTLPGGSSEKAISREQVQSMSLSEMMKLKAEHPDLYAEYIK